ncbi:50S ribosomal protein L17 [Candidatus Woesebacteria bacterium RIFOXYC1_FULL_31_51]|uniref:50S ribosomal protein L17 n=1 Tax=Candidatus Woesebacteria bacterium GW2011_GWC2_31_9 TaxID=1618586 RepID=A0A0F9YLN9_9BACT|nr:MAG: 50S ribosomal protein L17, large subunit ribosomal protein L17 [Candidatus Woesebacteria bacterium GW2011_GWF1_31_35]KKP23340.1 MAG: 50S ribosomal protein L17 [Candidatus Woesebacteria bacterium GW2011_GWC1_30_29]KKP26142.1 MAG: 50S ribosomal protein L17 [Candidatus Woesebacteria bacterium GW2011_GWD1_31_12]KKP27601.1 MAG: 50S ribosomal protein L17 [Candidatus Woesebacteria bacterium GW2011_GWB1_31_29]KKP30839.1 MAG: 50S ribosomal protein L17 [Candidatus Woesebacteria bacterium GW2011_G
MVKKVFGKKLSRERATREALFVSLVESLVINKKINTTRAKAKAVIGLIDRLVSLAKKGTLASKRQILKRLKGNKKIATIIWTEVVNYFPERNSGFTRIIPISQRKGDLAKMVRLEWTEVKLKKEELKKEDLKTKKDKKVKNGEDKKVNKKTK